MTEYSIKADYTLSLALAGLVFLISIIQDFIDMLKAKSSTSEVKLYEIGLLSINGIILLIKD
jgi:hypothetical protein